MGSKLILVSASPRRKQLMQSLELEFTVDAHTHFEEKIPEGMPVEQVPVYFAEQKSQRFHRDLKRDEVLVSADTVVVCNGQILGKPHHRSEAKKMLAMLSGGTHKVISAVCVRSSSKCITECDTTTVTFEKLSKEDIGYYVEKFRPVDKAGGYGIQEWIGMAHISRIEGSYYSVMGLPTHLLYSILKKF